MIVGDVVDLQIVGVFDRGVPNQERVVLRIFERIDLGQYGVILAVRGRQGNGWPLKDNFFWFGDGIVSPGDWIFLYTGTGAVGTTEIPGGSSQKIYTVRWGREKTIFNHPDLIPMLIRIDAVQVPVEQPALPPAGGQQKALR